MPVPDSGSVPTKQVSSAVSDLDRRLRRMRVARSDRRMIVEEVRADLQAAAADGVGPAVLLGPDVDAFARRAIGAGGYRTRPRDYPRILAGGVLMAGIVIVAMCWLIMGVLQPAFSSWFDLDGRYPTLGPIVVFGGIALAGLLGALIGLRTMLGKDPAARATVRRAALLLPIGSAAGVVAVLAVANSPDYRSTPGVVTVQVLFVVGGAAIALVAARWWAVQVSDADSGRKPDEQ